ncbi:MAG TPA: hypothetical protein VFQ44_10830 [Streptosporangiaceae bacterium]|nr:hypothetical protein [Streptosporangiaceae bacterium]
MRETVRLDTTLILAPEAGSVYASKRVFAWLSQDAAQLPPKEAELIRRRVPWTRDLADVATQWHASRQGLLELVERERERFVIKPTDQGGGEGVTAGRDATDSQWRGVIEDALNRGNHIVQEFHPPDLVDQPVLLPTEQITAVLPTTAVYGPLVMGGKLSGILVRQSINAKLSVVNPLHGAFMNTAFLRPRRWEDGYA